jgi:hypothetical protein
MAAERPHTGPSTDDAAVEARRIQFFTERLAAELVNAIEGGDVEATRRVLWRIAGHLRPALMVTEGLTEFRKPEITARCADDFARLKAILDAAVSLPATAASDASAVLQALESCFRFVLSIERPELARVTRLAAALKPPKVEPDAEEFLVSYRTNELGLLGPQLDPHLAEVLLGMRQIDGEIDLPGDMTVKRRGRKVSLASFEDDQIRDKLIEFARARRSSEQKHTAGSREHQMEAVDELSAAALSFSLRWRISIDWNEVGELLDDRTAGELEQVLHGCSVEEMGKTNYNHFREQLPRIRKAALDVQRAKNIKL